MTYQYELPCYDRCKSFYGKAQVTYDLDAQTATLKSYRTFVCRFHFDTGEFERLWSGYSATTMRHINSFCIHIGQSSLGGKAWWDKLPIAS